MVSIIMPVYNGEKFLKEALNSVLAQTFTDFELLIINDGSTDNTENIIKSYSDKRIKYIYQKNQGVARSLNNGIQLAERKYIWRHDADDTSLPTKLRNQVEFLESHPDYVLCSTQIAFMTESGKIAMSYRRPHNNYFHDQSFITVNRNQFDPYSPITHATILARTEIFKNIGGYRTEFLTAEDVDLWLRLLPGNKMAVLNSCDYFVRLSSNSATATHGWKNRFFRELAFKYFDQRAKGDKDDLQKGIPIVLPEIKPNVVVPVEKGKKYRSDLLDFIYPLYVNAKDWKNSLQAVKASLKDGWKLTSTWKGILMPLIGTKLTKSVVKFKRLFK